MKIYLESPPTGSDADDVSVAYSGHGDHQEVDTVPVRKTLAVFKVRGVSRILQLKKNASNYMDVSSCFQRTIKPLIEH